MADVFSVRFEPLSAVLNRLFEIIYLLLNKKITTANELAEHFEVSVRTIYRDIDTLSSAGIPIYALQGKRILVTGGTKGGIVRTV